MKRQIINIDRDKCNGCGQCVPNCMEGALQIIDGKATLVSELMCDGLGACIGHCPIDAITVEEREAEPYSETKVMEEIVKNGKNVVIAHLKHLKEHDQDVFLAEGFNYLDSHKPHLAFDTTEVKNIVLNKATNINIKPVMEHEEGGHCGCPGSKSMAFQPLVEEQVTNTEQKSALEHWPVQLHLINPMASHFKGADLLIAADCVAFALGNFHQKYLKGKKVVIACPKLDARQEIYVAKFVQLINDAKVNTIQVMIMEVPCCGGLLAMVRNAAQQALRKVPIKVTVVGIQGEILDEEWV